MDTTSLPSGPGTQPMPRLHVLDHLALTQYVEDIANLMGLGQWHLSVLAEPDSKMRESMEDEGPGDLLDYEAFCYPHHGMESADLWVNPKFRAKQPEELRATIVHELLHCHHAREEALVCQELSQFGISPVVHKVVKRWWHQANEYAVESIARAWAPALPTLTWPEKGDEAIVAFEEEKPWWEAYLTHYDLTLEALQGQQAFIALDSPHPDGDTAMQLYRQPDGRLFIELWRDDEERGHSALSAEMAPAFRAKLCSELSQEHAQKLAEWLDA